MRRSSIITIILLVLVIIGLTVALVMTNLPKEKVEVNPGVEDVDNQDDNVPEVPKAEEPKQVALNSDIAVEMATVLHPSGNINFAYFYEFQKGFLDQDSMSNDRKLQVAFSKIYQDKDNGIIQTVSKSEMDNVMMSIFGNTNYTPARVMYTYIMYDYDNATNCFKSIGQGGGGQGTHMIAGIYKIDEYSDRYEAYAKALVIDIGDIMYENGAGIGTAWDIKNADSTSPEYNLERYFQFYGTQVKKSYETIDDIVNGISPREFANAKITYDYTNQYKLLTKYFDQAMEYKHTFMKNEDGSYYWAKSEIIK